MKLKLWTIIKYLALGVRFSLNRSQGTKCKGLLTGNEPNCEFVNLTTGKIAASITNKPSVSKMYEYKTRDDKIDDNLKLFEILGGTFLGLL